MDCTEIGCFDPIQSGPTRICLVLRRLIISAFYGKPAAATIEKEVCRFAPALGFWLLVVGWRQGGLMAALRFEG
jgi:hypothetical protein